jgi:uridine kinase
VAASVPAATGEDCVRVAIDGVDGAGKTTFADELACVLRTQRAVVRVSADDFHRPRATRYRRGRHSPEGFWLDSFDYARLRADVLDPLGPGGSRLYRRAAHDLAPEVAPPGAVLVLDGLFLHRDELAGLWDLSVWLEVPFEVTAGRMAARYVESQRLYIAGCDPASRADFVIEN